jgi:hypothetical protein
MTRPADLPISTSPITHSVPIVLPLPEQITPISPEEVHSENVFFVAENVSVATITRVIEYYLTGATCSFEVFYSTKEKYRFFVSVALHVGRMAVSDFILMFMERGTVAVISPVEKEPVTKATEIDLRGAECLRRIKGHQIGQAESRGGVIYLLAG